MFGMVVQDAAGRQEGRLAQQAGGVAQVLEHVGGHDRRRPRSSPSRSPRCTRSRSAGVDLGAARPGLLRGGGVELDADHRAALVDEVAGQLPHAAAEVERPAPSGTLATRGGGWSWPIAAAASS